ncbi:hypothetical protein VTI74DRAFT_256 [Chaetomium olivicolor]
MNNSNCFVDDPRDPDVAGFGVTLAFLTSVCLTGAIVVTLYIRNALSERQYTDLDRHLLRKVWAALGKASGDDPGAVVPRSIKHEAVSHALFRLLVALSDQQLAGGMALAVAAYLKLADPASFSVYSFRMATATVWQAFFTHMCAVAVLRDDFCRQRGSKWRLLAMTALVTLLAPILLLSNFPAFLLEPAMSVKCACGQLLSSQRNWNVNFVLQSVLTVLVVVGGYSRRLIELVRGPKSPHGHGNWLTALVPSQEEASTARAQLAKDKAKELERMANRRLYVPDLWPFFHIVESEIRQSFLWELIWLSCYYTFSISSLGFTWTVLPPLSQWSLSFGQLVPLALVIMSLMPLYDDYKEYIEANTTRTETVEVRPDAAGNAGAPINSPKAGNRSYARAKSVPVSTPPLRLYEEAAKRHPSATNLIVIAFLLLMFLALQFLGLLMSGVLSYLLLRANATNGTIRAVFGIPLALMAFSFFVSTGSQLGGLFGDRFQQWRRPHQEQPPEQTAAQREGRRRDEEELAVELRQTTPRQDELRRTVDRHEECRAENSQPASQSENAQPTTWTWHAERRGMGPHIGISPALWDPPRLQLSSTQLRYA